uniref:Uncharacterized protein n=1 Tax=uncultured bacterium CSLF42 TaxID=1091574 RepID=G4WW00_9BACT|nr:hypothetical protein [uncultured bacterium CSLF42]
MPTRLIRILAALLISVLAWDPALGRIPNSIRDHHSVFASSCIFAQEALSLRGDIAGTVIQPCPRAVGAIRREALGFLAAPPGAPVGVDGYVANGDHAKRQFEEQLHTFRKNDVTADYQSRLTYALSSFLAALPQFPNDLGASSYRERLEILLQDLRAGRLRVYGFNAIVQGQEDFIFDWHNLDGRELFIATNFVDDLASWGWAYRAVSEEFLLHTLICPIVGHERAIRMQELYYRDNYSEKRLPNRRREGKLPYRLRAFINHLAELHIGRERAASAVAPRPSGQRSDDDLTPPERFLSRVEAAARQLWLHSRGKNSDYDQSGWVIRLDAGPAGDAVLDCLVRQYRADPHRDRITLRTDADFQQFIRDAKANPAAYSQRIMFLDMPDDLSLKSMHPDGRLDATVALRFLSQHLHIHFFVVCRSEGLYERLRYDSELVREGMPHSDLRESTLSREVRPEAGLAQGSGENHPFYGPANPELMQYLRQPDVKAVRVNDLSRWFSADENTVFASLDLAQYSSVGDGLYMRHDPAAFVQVSESLGNNADALARQLRDSLAEVERLHQTLVLYVPVAPEKQADLDAYLKGGPATLWIRGWEPLLDVAKSATPGSLRVIPGYAPTEERLQWDSHHRERNEAQARWSADQIRALRKSNPQARVMIVVPGETLNNYLMALNSRSIFAESTGLPAGIGRRTEIIDTVHDMLIDWQIRPDILTIRDLVQKQGLTIDDIIAAGRDCGYRVDVPEAVLTSLPLLVDYVLLLVECALADFPDRRMLSFGRDGELIHDVFRLVLDRRGDVARAILFPGSQPLWKAGLTRQMTPEQKQQWRRLFDGFRITSDGILHGPGMVAWDSGTKGTVHQLFIHALTEALSLTEENVLAWLEGRLIFETPRFVKQASQYLTIFIDKAIIDDIRTHLPTGGSLSIHGLPTLESILVHAIQRMPRHYGDIHAIEERDGVPIPVSNPARSSWISANDSNNLSDVNPEFLHPVGSMIVQFHIVQHVIERLVSGCRGLLANIQPIEGHPRRFNLLTLTTSA